MVYDTGHTWIQVTYGYNSQLYIYKSQLIQVTSRYIHFWIQVTVSGYNSYYLDTSYN